MYGLSQGLYQYCNCDNSNYNALQTKLHKQFSRGLDFLLTYTYSKALTDTEGGGVPSNSYDVRSDYGPASWDRTHTLTLQYDWYLPFGRNQHWKLGGSRVADLIAGGWRLSGVHTFASGEPFTPTVSNAPLLNDPDLAQVRADVVGNWSVPNPSAGEWFNPAAFSEPQQPYRQGTAGRNSLRGPGLSVSNVSLAKNLLGGEKRSLELRADAFNVFNQVNLANPASTIDEAGVGQITSLLPGLTMRQMQFGLHFQF